MREHGRGVMLRCFPRPTERRTRRCTPQPPAFADSIVSGSSVVRFAADVFSWRQSLSLALGHTTRMEQSKPPPPKASDIDDPSRLIRVGGPVDRACVSLRFFGDSLIPEELTQLLGCQPTEARRKGAVIPDKRYHRVAATGTWRLEGTEPATADIEQQVLALLGRVTSDLQVWQRLTAEFAADVFCGLFLDESNRGFRLSPRVTQILSERGIEIGFDIYSS